MNALPLTWNWNWTEFCGSDSFKIWIKNQEDLSCCFQVLCLQIPLLSLIAIISAYYSGLYLQWVLRTRREMFVISCRLLCTFLLVVLPIVKIVTMIWYYHEMLFIYQYLFAVLKPFCWLLHICYLYSLRNKLGPTLRGPVLLGSFWTLYYAVCVIYARSSYLQYKESSDTSTMIDLVFAVVELVVHTAYGFTLIPSEDLNFQRIPQEREEMHVSLLGHYQRFAEDFDHEYLGVAYETRSWLSKLLFLWVNPLMEQGVKRKIRSSEDLFDIPESLNASLLHRRLSQQFELPANVQHSSVRPRAVKISLLRALHRCFALEFYAVGILKFFADVIGFLSPLFLNRLITFIESRSESILYGYLYASGIFLTSLLGSFFLVHFDFNVGKVGMKLRASLIMKIYHKLLMLPAVTATKISIGEVINYISTDVDRIVNACQSFHAVWSIPFQIIVTLYLLYTQVGIAFIAGVIFSIILIPINKYIANKIGTLSVNMMREKDERVRLMTEVITGIRTIKLHVWEQYFINKILGIRTNEMRYLKYRKYLDAVCVYFWATTPVIISILTFTVFVFMGGELNAAIVFTSIALLNMLISPLNAFPWVLNGVVEAWVSVKRVQKLIEIEDIDLGEYYTDMHTLEDFDAEFSKSSDVATPATAANIEHKLPETEMYLRKGNFSWQPNYFHLFDINLVIKKGSLVCIYGPVGSGKSSLLAAFAAEIEKLGGTLAVKDLDAGFGYVTQTPWIQQCTVRENILFGRPFDSAKYKKVIKACSLEEDLRNFPNGDMEFVGEAGSTLSGGQKARIALSRAVYQDKPVYLLDDIFSAVDPPVANHIFQYCVNGLLKDKTRLFVTHYQKFLMFADKVVILKEGCIEKQGPPSKLFSKEEFVEETELKAIQNENEPEDWSFIKDDISSNDQIGQELSAVGTVSFSVYLSYWKAVGGILATLILASVLAMQLSRNATDWWLSVWVSADARNISAWGRDIFSSTGIVIRNDVDFFLIVYGLIGLVNSVVTIVRAYLFAYGGIKAAIYVHTKLLNVVTKAQILFFDVTPLGQIINRFSSDTYIVDDSLPFVLNNLLAQLFSVIGTIGMAVYGLPWICLFLAPLIPLYHWLQNHYRLTSRELKRLSSVTLSPLYGHFSETVSGLTVIRAARETCRFKREHEDKLEANQKCRFSAMAASLWLSIRLQLIGVTIIGGVCIISILQHQFDVAHSGFVGLAISYALSLTSKLGGVISVFTETEQEMIAMERICEYIEKQVLEPEGKPNFDISLPFSWPTDGVVSFRNVYLQYRSTSQMSLRNITFETFAGEKIGIIGRTGAGKSSLLQCLFRTVEITGGNIIIDNIDISEVSLKKLRSKLAIIPQDPFLFAGTVRENIDPSGLYGEAEIWNAVAKCYLTKIVRKLGGLSAPMESGGKNLSAGEKQLFCLCRAVLRSAKVICIDEATSNIDFETEKLIQDTVRSCFRYSTVFTIAHRTSTILDSDRVLVMGNGELLENASPKILLKNPKSMFYALVNGNEF